MTLPDDALCIVIDLAAVDLARPKGCPLCHGPITAKRTTHLPTCPWRRAVELLAEPEGSPR